MASIWLVVAIFYTICWSWIQAKHVTLEKNETLTWNESIKYCERIGKVLYHVQDSESIKDLKDILEHGDQAWINATVELSDFFLTPVCKSTIGLEHNKTSNIGTDIVRNCITFCKDFQYFGLKESDCYCIVNNKSLNTSKACKSLCINDSTHLCGGRQSFSLYEKAITHKIEPGYKECVYVQTINNTTKLFTASCVLPEADGGLCETQNNTACGNNNWTSIGTDLCRMDLTGPFSWKHTQGLCAQIEGQLYSSDPRSMNLDDKRKYWLGINRVATLREKKEEIIKNHTYRSVVIKVGENVLIEAEDSQANHTIVCKDISERTASSSTQSTKTNEKKTDFTNPDNSTYVATPEAVVNESTLSSKTLEKEINSKQTDNRIIYLVVAGAGTAVLIIIAIAIAIVCVFRRRYHIHSREENATNSSNERQMLQRNNFAAKTARKADMKKDHVQNSIDKVATVCATKSVDQEYDKIEFDKKLRQVTDINEDGQNIYDHTFQSVNDNKYDLTHFSGDSNANANETYHTTRPV